MKDMQLVILMGGKATRLAPLSYALPKGLLTVNHKPGIYNMIIDYVKKGLKDITFVVSPGNESIVKSFINKSFSNLNVNYVVQENPQGPLHAFALCKDYITKPTLLLLGDTMCETNLDYSYDWLGYMNIHDHSHSRWCLIKTNNEDDIQEIIDKPDYTPETNKVLIGLYNFRNPEVLRDALSQSYEKKRGELQLSSMIEYYMARQQMKGVIIKSWKDTGTLEDYTNTFKDSIVGRNFNSFNIDDYGVLTKTSSYGKLKSELMWLKKIQSSPLSFLIPRFIGYKQTGDTISYQTEFVNDSSLAEYYLYYDISEDNWKHIFRKFLNVGNLMWSKKAPRSAANIVPLARKMYIDKTEERIKLWERKDILEQDYVYCNGEKLLSFDKVYKLLQPKLEKLINTSSKYYSIIHGDPCFSNVIYIPSLSLFKFIDPRGNFGVDMIYGDSRYDVAKTRHNYHGLYDYITQGLYNLKEIDAGTFEYSFFTNNIINPNIFDDVVKEFGYDINDIELIEGLLFISMIPLHSEDKNAQVMYYLTGLKCLNNQIKELI
ncbi:MAG: hypothetical protein E7379_00015 [Clostridiales bacterium]|nr:hypothetical protein [Clostridiales bacterium]